MKNSNRSKSASRIAIMGLTALAATAAHATDGYFDYGYGVQAKGVGGAAVAFPQDALAIAANPAGIAFLENRLDFGLTYFQPDRSASLGPYHFDGNNTQQFYIPEAGYKHSLSSDVDTAYAAVGAVMRSYRFDRYRTKQKPEDKPKLTGISVLSQDVARSESLWQRHKPVLQGAFITRDLVSEPANILTPPEMAIRAAKLAELGLDIEVLGLEDLTALKFGALLGVAQGSRQAPRVVIMRWNGAGGATEPLLFVGKGVTFDSGGISIKPAAGMEDMKWDMGGAGTVIGLMAALAGRNAKVDAVGIVGLVENMVDGNAQRPGDVVTSYSGQTIEVINTDAEGRLVLADVIWYAQERFKPKVTIDLATLTGAIIVGLGHEFAGLFSNDDELPGKLIKAGAAVGEKLWHMPLHENFDKAIKSDIADMKNVGGRPGGASTAAAFIQRFVNKTPWAHLDIAGMAWADKDSATISKGATGYGVRLLDQFVASHYEG